MGIGGLDLGGASRMAQLTFLGDEGPILYSVQPNLVNSAAMDSIPSPQEKARQAPQQVKHQIQ